MHAQHHQGQCVFGGNKETFLGGATTSKVRYVKQGSVVRFIFPGSGTEQGSGETELLIE